MSTALFCMGTTWIVQLGTEQIDALLAGNHVYLHAQLDGPADYEPSVLVAMSERLTVHRYAMFTRLSIPREDLQGLAEGGMCQIGDWSVCGFGALS